MDLKPLIDAVAKKGADVSLLDIKGVMHAALPAGIALQRLDLEQYLPAPLAIRRSIDAHDLRGFIAYVNKFKGSASQTYAKSLAQPALVARLDDHMPGTPSHVEHEATYPCPTTVEWNTWRAANKKAMEQKDFADFLESNLRDILEPNGADMLAMATNFRDISGAEFQSTVNRTNGRVNFQYTQKDSNAGQIQLPDVFKIAVPVFEGMSARYTVMARLRWRIKDQTLHLWFELDRPDITYRAAFDEMVELVESETKIPVFRAI